ncbi:MAG: hypothetical protein ACLP8A_16035 [Methylovirgula sp.]
MTDDERKNQRYSKIIVKEASPYMNTRASKEMRDGSPVGARVEAEAAIAARQRKRYKWQFQSGQVTKRIA